jgi:hypothetical protein
LTRLERPVTAWIATQEALWNTPTWQ